MGRARLEVLLLLLQKSAVQGFFDQLFGGGGIQFEQARPQRVKWPRGVPDECSKGMSWLKGTEWKWNNDGWTVKLEKDGSLEAPVNQCQRGTCKWSADDGKFYFMLGDAGLGEFNVGTSEKPADMKGMKMKGKLKADGQRITLSFVKIFDFSAVDLDKDLYGALDLPDDASELDIKKAYRKLSIKYHPDKDPSPEARQKFNDVRDAHEILNDPDKKILYDTGGMEAVQKATRGEVEKTSDAEAALSVTLAELYTGTKKDVSVNRRIVCRGCRLRPNAPQCKGCGKCPNEVKVEKVQMGPFMTQQQVEVPSKEKCKQANEAIEVTVEKGMMDGEKVSFPRMADQRPGMLPGALHLQLKASKHNTFSRRGNDLHVEMSISLREALLGWKQTIRHLDGHTVELDIDKPTKNNQVIKVAGEGMPLKEDSSSFGDLVIKITVDFPKTLTQAQKDAVAKIFPETPPREEL